MNEMAMQGNLAKVTAAQSRLRSAVERTGDSSQRLERLFGKAAEAGARLSQVTARPTIAARDYFSFVIDRLMLQLADLRRLKVDIRLIINDKVIETARQLRELLQGLGGSLDVTVGAAASPQPKETKSPIDTWIERLQKIVAALKDFGAAFKSFGDGFKSLGEGFKGFGEGFKSFAEGVKTIVDSIKDFKSMFTGKGKKGKGSKAKANGKGKPGKGERTKPKAAGKTDPKAKAKTETKAKAKTESKAKAKTESDVKEKTDTRAEQETTKTKVPKDAAKPGKFKDLFKFGSKALKSVGKVVKPLDVGLAAVDVATSDNKPKAAVQAGASLAGSALGAVIGSMFLPGVGTVAGGMLGGWVGDKVGGFLGDKWFGKTSAAVEPTRDMALISTERESAASSPANGALSAGSAPIDVPPSKNFNISVDGVTVNFPKEEVDHHDLAQIIGQQIVSQMDAAMQNQA